MSRQLDFRVWARNDKFPDGKFFYCDENTHFLMNLNGDLVETFPDEYRPSYAGMCWARIGNSDIEIQQNIGIPDSRGEKVYEGDVVKLVVATLSREIIVECVVEWSDRAVGYVGIPRDPNGPFVGDGTGYRLSPEAMTVIGNVKESEQKKS